MQTYYFFGKGRRGLLLALSIAITILSSCFIRPEKKSAKNKSNLPPSLLDRGSVFLDRIGDGTSARIQFRTARPALCGMIYFSQDPTGTPSRAAPKDAPCSPDEKGRTEFSEKIDGLKTDTLYFVIISLWEPSHGKDKAESITIKEASAAATAVGTDTNTGATPNTVAPGIPGSRDGSQLASMFIAKLDLPLRFAEVYRHELAAPTDVATIKEKMKMTVGCQTGVPDAKSTPFGSAAADPLLNGLVTQDLAAGNAIAHPHAAGRLILRYPSINTGIDKWSLLYKLNAQDFLLPIRPISRLSSLELESTDIVTVDEGQLAEAVDPLKIDVKKPLKIRWTISPSLMEVSYMIVQIGRPNEEKAIYCVFPADGRSGSIEEKLLSNLEDGKYVVSFDLLSRQLWLKYGWLVSLHDWRSGRIEK